MVLPSLYPLGRGNGNHLVWESGLTHCKFLETKQGWSRGGLFPNAYVLIALLVRLLHCSMVRTLVEHRALTWTAFLYGS